MAVFEVTGLRWRFPKRRSQKPSLKRKKKRKKRPRMSPDLSWCLLNPPDYDTLCASFRTQAPPAPKKPEAVRVTILMDAAIYSVPQLIWSSLILDFLLESWGIWVLRFSWYLIATYRECIRKQAPEISCACALCIMQFWWFLCLEG